MNLAQRRNAVSGIHLVGAMAALAAQSPTPQNVSALHSVLAQHGLAPSQASAAIPAHVAAALQNAVAAAPLSGTNPYSPQGLTAAFSLPSKTNRFPFPMPAATLGAGAAGVSSAQAQVPTKPDRLVMSESTGPSSLTDISIGIAPQFGSLTGNFPISAFAANATDTVMNFDTAQTGQAIVLSLFNSGAGASTVLSGFFAEVAQ